MEYASFTGGEAAIKVYSDFEYVNDSERMQRRTTNCRHTDLVACTGTLEIILLLRISRSSNVQYLQSERRNINRALFNG